MSKETILELIVCRAAQFPDAPAVHYRAGGVWHAISLRSLLRISEHLAESLLAAGLKPGERLAIMCRTRVEWLLAELAAMVAGVIVVGIDAHASDAQIALVLSDAGVSGLIIDSDTGLSRLPYPILGELSLIITIDRDGSADSDPLPQLRRWDQLIGAEPSGALAQYIHGVDRDDTSRAFQRPDLSAATADTAATLLYTSGTTGKPKGILYRHVHLAVACRSILEEFPVISKPGGSTLCWLPMSALFQRMMNYVALASGVSVYFVEDPAAVVDAAQDVRPTYFIGVPRFFEKLYQGIQQELATKPRWVQKIVRFSLAYPPGARGLPGEPRVTARQRVIRQLVLRQLRGVLGDRLRFMITGSAPTPLWMLDYFHRLGILLLEAYGLSENTVPIAANRPDAYRFGSAGKVFRANDLRLADDGEILVRGPGLFDGYWQEATSASDEVFSEDGFFRTGDLGKIDADGFLYISGRKSEVFKASTGRRVAPAKVEATYKRIAYIDQIVVVGQGRPYPAGLLRVDERLLVSTLAGRGVSVSGDTGSANLAALPAVRSQIEADIEAAGAELSSYERIRRFDLLPLPLTLQGGELTSSLKLKRDVIERKYQELIDRLYSELHER